MEREMKSSRCSFSVHGEVLAIRAVSKMCLLRKVHVAFSSKNIYIKHFAYPKLHVLFYSVELGQEDPLLKSSPLCQESCDADLQH